MKKPLRYFESAYNHFKITRFTKAVNFEEFITNHQIYLPKLRSFLGKQDNVRYFLYNLEFDLGFNVNSNLSSSALTDFMEHNSDLVIVLTYFNHGLCQLKNELRWHSDDVIYVQQNKRLEEASSGSESIELWDW